jgi:hypothetical protein
VARLEAARPLALAFFFSAVLAPLRFAAEVRPLDAPVELFFEDPLLEVRPERVLDVLRGDLAMFSPPGGIELMRKRAGAMARPRGGSENS